MFQLNSASLAEDAFPLSPLQIIQRLVLNKPTAEELTERSHRVAEEKNDRRLNGLLNDDRRWLKTHSRQHSTRHYPGG